MASPNNIEYCAKSVAKGVLDLYTAEALGRKSEIEEGDLTLLDQSLCIPPCSYSAKIVAKASGGKITSVSIEESGTCLKGN